MKTFTIIVLLTLAGSIAFAQDTAFVNTDKTTALFFPFAVKILSADKQFVVRDKGNGVLTVKAISKGFETQALSVQDLNTKKVFRIPVAYSYGRAGRRIGYGPSMQRSAINDSIERTEQLIAMQLIAGKRENIADHKRNGGVKAWINKLSLAGNRIFLRLDVRNRSNLPYDIDFVRFYIRDRKTINRMATHEQEIVPRYSTLRSRTSVIKGQEVAKVFAFKRFSIADDEALFIEVYERSGNRHLYLQIRQDDLDKINVVPMPKRYDAMLADNINNYSLTI